ncbi:MAG: methyl-accepting chemotaxis protein [Desulfobacteraceae bacterium]|nr:MAG: methyl-accepting chemotaxis protein [Desulfobacteraceae bacterium]
MKKSFDRLTILQKIFFCGMILSLPVIVLLYYMVSGFNQRIGVARLEVSGCRLLAPLQRLAREVPEYLLLARIHEHDGMDVDERADRLAQEIERQFTLLENEGKDLEDVLQIGEKSLKAAGIEPAHIKKIQGAWQSLKDNWKGGGELWELDFNDRIVKPVHALVKRIGDTSNMALDSEIVTYYLIDAALLSLEKNQQKLGEFLLFGESVIFKGILNRQDIARFVTFTGTIRDDVARIQESIETALQENKRLRGSDTSLQKNIPPLLEEYRSSINPLLFILSRLANDPQFRITTSELAEPVRGMIAAGTKLREASMAEVQGLLDQRIEDYAGKRLIALFLSLGTLFIAAAVAFFISRGITRSLRRVIDIAGKVALGDLRRAMEDMKRMGISEKLQTGETEGTGEVSKNEIDRLFKAVALMITSLNSLLAQVGKSGIQVAASSSEIAASARELEATVAEQAASINEVNATSKEIAATSQEFAGTIKKVSRMADRAAELAGQSMDSLGQINATMKGLLDETTQSCEKLRAVGEKMEGVTQVITTITKVANQTNLLSLNAAIEAEKAGEHGIGFSVVAREIRRLADQTAVSVLDIEETVRETQEAVRSGVAAVEAYTEQTRASTEKIAEVSVILLTAIEHTQDLAPQFETVNQGMQMQSQSAAQISEAMGQLDEAARQTKESLIEFKTVTEQLNQAASDLQNEVARFSTD